MCFDNDYDWCAEVQETKEGPLAGDQTACDECRTTIRPGDWCRKVFQQEHENCRMCEEDGDDPDPECEHDYGLTYDYVCCQGCATILKAIEEVEEKEGCPWYLLGNSQPRPDWKRFAA